MEHSAGKNIIGRFGVWPGRNYPHFLYKEDYYVQTVDLFGLFCFVAEWVRQCVG
jgi:hypothetical protein